MATIIDYASLVTAIGDWSHDASISTWIDQFIQGAEERIYRGIFANNNGRGIRYIENPLAGTINTTTGVLAVPADYLGLRYANVVTASGTFQLEPKEPEQLYQRYPIRNPQGIPAMIAREGSNFIFGPFPDGAYTISGIYWNQPPALSSTNTTNWMTINVPMLILAACMIEVSPFTSDDTMQQRWQAIYQSKLSDLIGYDQSERFLGAGAAPEVEFERL